MAEHFFFRSGICWLFIFLNWLMATGIFQERWKSHPRDSSHNVYTQHAVLSSEWGLSWVRPKQMERGSKASQSAVLWARARSKHLCQDCQRRKGRPAGSRIQNLSIANGSQSFPCCFTPLGRRFYPALAELRLLQSSHTPQSPVTVSLLASLASCSALRFFCRRCLTGSGAWPL